MELEKALLSITAIVIVVLFIGMAIQPATTHSNQRTVSVSAKQEIEYDRYFIQKPVNASNQFSNMFITWIGNYEHANPYAGGKVSAFHMPSQAQVKELFPLFLKQNPNAVKLLNQITAQETAKFQRENHEAGLRFIHSLGNGSKLPKLYEYNTNNSRYIVVNIAHPMYPGGFPTSTGEYVMVSVNYYSIPWYYPGPWWAPWEGHWGSLNYGEQDTINILYVGSDAQTWYNQEYNTIQNFNSLNDVGSNFISALTAIGAYYVIEAVTAAIASEIFAILTITGGVISFIQSYMGSQLHSMYDSTYANPLNGEPKFLWMYYTAVYMYDAFGSYFTWNGYTNSGTVSMLPYIPDISDNPAFSVVAAALAGEAHGIAGKIGWNSWGTVN